LDSHLVARITDILENASDFFVPIRELGQQLEAEGFEIDPEDLQRALLADDRFEIIQGINYKEGASSGSAAGVANLTLQGEPRVKLVSREMTAEDIFEGMLRSLTRMNQALQSAWDTRPTDDQETEDQLLEIMAAGQQLEREIQTLVDEQDVKDT
jgi:hypothetical protein